MRKIVLLVILAGLASWYFHFGRVMTEDSVTAYYDKQLELLAAFETEAMCAHLAADYHAKDVTFSSAGAETTELNKKEACKDLKEGVGIFKKLSAATHGMLEPTFDGTIKSIKLSEGGKLATVEGTMTIKMGDMLVTRSKFTEMLIRRNGKILSRGGESKSWMYGDG